MRLHRFYLSTAITSSTFDITDRDLVHQWKSVFRYNVGSQVILFDGSGVDYLCMIGSLRNLGATVSVMKKTTLESSVKRSVYLCASLIKKDNFEMVVQKATELGVHHIIPILSGRTEKKKINMSRLEKIAIEASEQSGRGDVPKIYEAMALDKLFESGVLPQEKIVLHPEGTMISKYIQNTQHVSITCFVGPEGGWGEDEIAFFKSYNVTPVSLGTQILRAETASVAVVSTITLM